jgi:3-deoxy-manno-octulosonate cytidylyltransferase (CMP-KDO synthetase)
MFSRAKESGAQQAMKIAIVIPARMSSTRLPGKPLLDIGGRPMVVRVWERLSRIPGVSTVVIATPDGEIAEAAERFGARHVITSASCRSGTDRVAEAAERMRADVIVNVQGDEPLVDPRHVTAAVGAVAGRRGAVMSTLRCPLSGSAEFTDPNAVKVLTDRAGRALYFSRSAVPFGMSAPVRFPTGGGDPVGRHIGIYAFTKKFLLKFASLPRTPLEKLESLEQLRAMEHGHPIHTAFVTRAARGVDTMEDLIRVLKETERK